MAMVVVTRGFCGSGCGSVNDGSGGGGDCGGSD